MWLRGRLGSDATARSLAADGDIGIEQDLTDHSEQRPRGVPFGVVQ
jgi:hypothetical protein